MGKEDEQNRDRICKLGTAAWKRLKKEQNWNDYMTLGESFVAGREWALNEVPSNDINDPRFKKAFSHWLTKYQVDDYDRSDRAKLFTVMQHRSEIEGWRATLTQTERLKLNHPTSVLRKWKAATEVRKPKLADKEKATVPELKQATSAQAAHIEEIEANREQLKARIEELEAELAKLREENTGLRNERSGTTRREFDSSIYRKLKALADPDAAPPEAKAYMHEVSAKFNELLDKTAPKAKASWLNDEEAFRKRKERREANSRRTTEQWAKRKASEQQAPPDSPKKRKGLVWTDTPGKGGNYASHPRSEAKIGHGRSCYTVTPGYSFGSGTFSGYSVSYMPNGTITDAQYLTSRERSLERAKAIAQRHYDKHPQ
jgi:hypothetical protein